MKTNGLTLCFVNQTVSASFFMTVRQKTLGLKREAKVLQRHWWKRGKIIKDSGFSDKLHLYKRFHSFSLWVVPPIPTLDGCEFLITLLLVLVGPCHTEDWEQSALPHGSQSAFAWMVTKFSSRVLKIAACARHGHSGGIWATWEGCCVSSSASELSDSAITLVGLTYSCGSLCWAYVCICASSHSLVLWYQGVVWWSRHCTMLASACESHKTPLVLTLWQAETEPCGGLNSYGSSSLTCVELHRGPAFQSTSTLGKQQLQKLSLLFTLLSHVVGSSVLGYVVGNTSHATERQDTSQDQIRYWADKMNSRDKIPLQKQGK